MRRVVRLGIVIFWLVMVVLLVRRTQPEPHSHSSWTLPPASAAAQAQEEWMGIYQQDQKVGYLWRRLAPTDTGYLWEERWRMKLRILNTPQTLHTEIRAQTNSDYALTNFSLRLFSGGIVFHVTGQVTEQTVHGHIKSAGETSPFSFVLREPLYLPATTRLALREAVPQPGEERRFQVFNPLAMQTDTITITGLGETTLSFNGRPQSVTKVSERFAGTTVHAWLDHEGKVVKEEAALGLVLLRENAQDALGGGWQNGTPPLDLVTAAAIPVRVKLENPRSLTYLRVKLSSPVDGISFAFPPRQQYQDNVLTVAREETAALATYTVPQTNLNFLGDLAATPFLQSTHPRVVAQMQRIVGSERDAVQTARRLLDWTYTTLEKTPSVGIPTALDTLATKRGDCNEHAVLFTALARASGLPARIAAGVVYLDSAFYYHAWAEVWLGKWVAVDPVFGQFPADATHIKFIEGGPEQHLGLLKLVGQVGMEIVEYK